MVKKDVKYRKSLPKGINFVKDPSNALNRIVFSSFRDLQANSKSEGVSLKFVFEGQEDYYFDHQLFSVCAGQFLVVNHTREFEVSIKAERPVKGMCIYLDPTLFSQIRQFWNEKTPDRLEYRPQTENPELFEAVFHADFNPLGSLFKELPAIIRSYSDNEDHQELYLLLAEKLFAHHSMTINQLKALPSIKKSTRRELFQRLLWAKAHIHSCFTEKLSLKELASVACLSEYHFLRSFRNAFGQTPNQYITQLRLKKAHALLSSGHYSVSEAAATCGYHDLQYFSKTFKKLFMVPPSSIMK